MKCAFCNNEAESGEHLWDNWLNEALPKKTRFNASKRLSINSKPIQFVSVGLNEKVPVVCPNRCNGGWMCDLTAEVRERFSETIVEGKPFSLSLRDSTLLAAFTFMKAAVMDYGYGDEVFFTRLDRKRLRVSLAIPPLARMWIAAYQGSARYSFVSNHYRVDADAPGPLHGMQFFCYTYILGNLALQFHAPRWKDIRDRSKPLVALAPNDFWRPATIKLWPYPGKVHWPPEKYLGDSTIEQFINRFKSPVKVLI